MKCIHCGLPLSPTNTPTHCPRCKAPLTAGAKPTRVLSQWQHEPQTRGRQGRMEDSPWSIGQSPHYGYAEATLQTQPPPPFSASARSTNGSYQDQLPFPHIDQTPLPQPAQMWRSTSTSAPSPISTPVEMAMRNTTAPHLMSNRTAGGMYAPAPSIAYPQKRPAGNLGFLIAGLCVLTGAFLLIYVYVMASGLPSPTAASVYAGITATPRSIMPSPAVATRVPTHAPSPTVSAFPGQSFIDNPQMASQVNINTAQPLQTTTVFRVNQRIYVTFNIHPNGKNGAICLYWYLNHTNVTQFPFAVTASAHAGYSYAIYGGSGAGYVEIYWASSIACSDKLLAQHVNFTVTT